MKQNNILSCDVMQAQKNTYHTCFKYDSLFKLLGLCVNVGANICKARNWKGTMLGQMLQVSE